MDAIECLLTRGSVKRLIAPAPDKDALSTILRAAATAPDHGRLRPWRFLVLTGDERTRLGDLLAAYLGGVKSEADAEQLDKEKAKAFRAPMIIVVAARPMLEKTRIPEIEQILAAGAAAQNIMLAAHALGFGAMWKTGEPAYDTKVKVGLGLEPTDHIIGFLYVGTRAEGDSFMPRGAPEGSMLELPSR